MNVTPQSRLLKKQPSAVATRNTASPLTPRLAVNTQQIKREPSPSRPFVKTTTTPRNPLTDLRNSPAQSPLNNVNSPLNNINNPRNTITRGKTTTTTPTINNSGGARVRAAYVTPRLAASPLTIKTGDIPKNDGQKSIKNGINNESTTVKSPTGSLFIGANNHDQTRENTIKQSPVFFYANDRQEDNLTKVNRPTSPAMSMFADFRSLAIGRGRDNMSEVGFRTRPTVTTSVSTNNVKLTKSPFSTSPTIPSTTRPISTQSIYKNIDEMTPDLPNIRTRPRTVIDSDFIPEMHENKRIHNRSSSTSSLNIDSPNSLRKRSSTWDKYKSNTSCPSSPLTSSLSKRPSSTSLSKINNPRSIISSSSPDNNNSNHNNNNNNNITTQVQDFAVEARRERKVLDLEISNSSLLAINRSLEREMKKQKLELRQYRRLSRAGRFSSIHDVRNDSHDDGKDSRSSQDVDTKRARGRVSSPFQEVVGDMRSEYSDDYDEESDDEIIQDEDERIIADLKKHRELLLDTACMNQSIQKCLTWTEDLIKDGKKALYTPTSDLFSFKDIDYEEGDREGEKRKEFEHNNDGILVYDSSGNNNSNRDSGVEIG